MLHACPPCSHRTGFTHARLWIVLALGLAGPAIAPGLSAQEPVRPFVPSTIVPNYDRIRIGQVEGLEGGAFVARTGDAGANWYNPAGLAAAEGTSVNASSSAYEWTTLELGGLNQTFKGGRLRSLGTYFGAVLGGDLLGSERLRLGFSVTHPVVWSPGSVSGSITGSSASDIERVDFYSNAETSTMLPGIAAALRLADGLRVGGGFAVGITSMKVDQQVANWFVSGPDVRRASSSLNFDGQYWQMQFTGGVQWEPSERVRLGATLATPGIRLGGSALLISHSSGAGPDGSEELVFQDQDAAFTYELPSRATVGVAVDVGRFEIEADVRYYGSRDAYDMLTSDSSFIGVRTDASGTTTIRKQAFAPLSEVTEAVTNVALGVNRPLWRSWRIHAGAFTDASPVGDPENTSFGVVDLTGVTLAVSFGGRLSGSVGLSSSWGTTQERGLGPTLGGTERTTSVEIRTMYLHYALSYTFN